MSESEAEVTGSEKLAEIGMEEFRGCQGEVFTLQTEAGEQHELRLAEVAELSEQVSTPKRRAFSVVFHGGESLPQEQHIHRLEHPKLGELHLFLVPLGPGGDSDARFEAVFT